MRRIDCASSTADGVSAESGGRGPGHSASQAAAPTARKRDCSSRQRSRAQLITSRGRNSASPPIRSLNHRDPSEEVVLVEVYAVAAIDRIRRGTRRPREGSPGARIRCGAAARPRFCAIRSTPRENLAVLDHLQELVLHAGQEHQQILGMVDQGMQKLRQRAELVDRQVVDLVEAEHQRLIVQRDELGQHDQNGFDRVGPGERNDGLRIARAAHIHSGRLGAFHGVARQPTKGRVRHASSPP
jgi:hypothetical protein